MRTLTDIIIPLGCGEAPENEPLKILLRSIEKNAYGVGRVIIVSDCAPDWLSDAVDVFPVPDFWEDNKDANLIAKTLYAIDGFNVDRFVWAADDNVFLHPVELCWIPTTFNSREECDYTGTGKWQTRVRHTFQWARDRGLPIMHSFDSHAPQYFSDAQRLLRCMDGIPWKDQPGLTVMTVFKVATSDTTNLMRQDELKSTAEREDWSVDWSKTFLGYNDRAWDHGLREELFRRYPDKCRYER